MPQLLTLFRRTRVGSAYARAATTLVPSAKQAPPVTLVPQTTLVPPRPLLRLQWRLTLSYLLTTVLATVIIEIALFGTFGYYVFLSRTFTREVAMDVQTEAQKAAAFLIKEPRDQSGLEDWLADALRPPAREGRGIGVEVSIQSGATTAAVADLKGNILAQESSGDSVLSAVPLDEQLLPVEKTLLLAARRGETSPDMMAQRISNAHVVAVAPIFRPETRQVIALAYVHTQPGFRVWDLFSSVAGSALVVAAFSGLIGGAIGFFTARRLTRRLSRIATAADAWARGDLSASAPETPTDELGVLAGRLNRMARDLTDLIALRQDVATLEERNRLARDLHDTVKQQVFATAMQVGAARALLPRDQEAARERLEVAERLAHGVQKELGAIIRELRPVVDGAKGEEALPQQRLQTLVADWSRQTDIRGEFLAGDVPTLAPRISEELYRITQEALANVARHSGATTVRVFLSGSREERTVTLSITDNGRGFSPVSARGARRPSDGGGFGLTTMRERAEALPEGMFVLNSAPGAGTRIEVRCGVGEGWNGTGEKA